MMRGRFGIPQTSRRGRGFPRACPWAVGLALLAGGCSTGPRLQVAADQAEYPFGPTIMVDGEIGAEEWAPARVLSVDLPDGRRVDVLLQRDRDHFFFGFVGLDTPAPREVHPEILVDTWGNGSESFDDNDWWFSVDRRLCWQRGGFGDGECRRVPPGWQATPLPVERRRAVEVAITFRVLDFAETYDRSIGLALRFVDSEGVEVAVWPLRAEVRRPSTWAEISLRH